MSRDDEKRNTDTTKTKASGRKTLSEGMTDATKMGVLFPGSNHVRQKPQESKRAGSRQKQRRSPTTSAQDIKIADQATKAFLLNELERKVNARDGTRSVEISMREAIVRAQCATALKGSPLAQRHLLDRIERYEREEASEIARQHEVFERYREDCWERIECAREKGGIPPDPLPHPDDIVLEPGKPVRVIGPLTVEEAATTEENCRLRDVLILQDELDRRAFIDSPENSASDRPGGALLIALFLNESLPLRLQIDEIRIALMQMKYQGMPKRVLLKELRRAWRSLGKNVRRGYIFPSMRIAENILESFVCLLNDYRRDRISLHEFANELFVRLKAGAHHPRQRTPDTV